MTQAIHTLSSIKSPLRYPGGKSRAIKFLGQFIPHDFKEYREPFFGGGSIGFYIAQQRSGMKLIANDLNYELYCFWDCLQNNHINLIRGVEELRQKFESGRDLYDFLIARRNSDLSPLQRGIDFFILNRITFSGVVDSGGYSQKAFEGRFTQSCIDRLIESHSIITNFEFHAEDFEGIIKRKGDSVFMFLDPPYYRASKSKLYGKKGILHTSFNHEALHRVLCKTNHRFLLTYDDSEYIRHLYKDFCVIEWDLQYGMNNYKQGRASKGKELLISNYL
ncbi:modification methylase [Helicobacter monodelphidis]|uniref:DNA adenine methylase n=1 Tax=Helicobacter sp. 15-1451 TaxID=2004995 RepID=UPI000DCE550C|nr:DNA adenine methylase [Helicobacter sp. 15-1451]RAX57308.1 modification methylase [Helicobacter sp. 15-1451]